MVKAKEWNCNQKQKKNKLKCFTFKRMFLKFTKMED